MTTPTPLEAAARATLQAMTRHSNSAEARHWTVEDAADHIARAAILAFIGAVEEEEAGRAIYEYTRRDPRFVHRAAWEDNEGARDTFRWYARAILAHLKSKVET